MCIATIIQSNGVVYDYVTSVENLNVQHAHEVCCQDSVEAAEGTGGCPKGIGLGPFTLTVRAPLPLLA